VVFTYSGTSDFITAINILKMLGSLEEINKEKCLNSVRMCFKENGSFSNFHNSNEADLRFVYAALAICNALGDFSLIDKKKVKGYIDSCWNYDGGYGLRPYCESHSGAVYCAIASYRLLGEDIPNEEETLEFLVNRQSVNERKHTLMQ
jgi:prenyltransferase beta subunit